MEWIDAIRNGIEYIEEHITDDITAEDVADHVNMSSFYFQKGFGMLCGYTVMEYVRNRRLTLAGEDLAGEGEKVIDTALKYGYESPDSFTKAFTRFHGISPSMVQKGNQSIRIFAPLRIEITLKGGYLMNYKIVKKDSFTVMGASKRFDYENCKEKIPQFWKEHFEKGRGRYVCGMFGINTDESMGNDSFEYLIADLYNPVMDIPEGFVTKVIPAFTWAVFSCDGPLPQALQDVNVKIFAEWLPALKEYEFAAGYCIEMYDAPDKYAKGTMDEKYHSEIWIPVKRK